MNPRIAIYVIDRHAIVTRIDSGRADNSYRQCIDWNVPVDPLPREAVDLRRAAARIGAGVAQEFPHGAVAKVVIPSSWCFCEVLRIDTAGRTEASLAYEFEDRLPVELERLTWATCNLENGYACVAAVFTDAARALLDGLEEHHIAVELLTVDAALMLTTLRTTENGMSVSFGDCPTWIAGASGDAGPFVRTLRCVENPRYVQQQIGLTMAHCGASPDLVRDAQPDEGAFVDQVLNALRDETGQLDLRQGELTYAGRWQPVRRQLIRCAMVAVGLLIVLAARLHWAAISSSRAVDLVAQRQDVIYQRVFPGMAVPLGASLRVQAERKRLEGITGTGGSDGLPRSQNDLSLFQALHELAMRIPPRIRLHVNEIEVDAKSIRANGQAATHASVGDWVQEINRSSLLRADPPRTNLRKDGTVDFRVVAKRELSNGSD